MLSLPYAALFFNLILHIKPIRLLILWFIYFCRITVQPHNLVGMHLSYYWYPLQYLTVTSGSFLFWILVFLLIYYIIFRLTYSDLCIQTPESKFRQCLLRTLAVLFQLIYSYHQIMSFTPEKKVVHSLLEFVFNIL